MVDDLASEAHALQREGRAAEAVSKFRTALAQGQLLSTSVRAALKSDLGVALNQDGRRREAVAVYSSSLNLAPAGRTYNNLAVVLQANGDTEAAQGAYRASLSLASDSLPSAVVLLNLFRCSLQGARWREWPLFEWLSRIPASPFARLEARAFLSGEPARIHEAAAMESTIIEEALTAWSCECNRQPRKESPPRRVKRLGRRWPLRVALLSDLDSDPSASLLRHALPLLHERGDISITLFSLSANPSEHMQEIAHRVPTVHLPPGTPASIDAADGRTPAAPGAPAGAPPVEYCEAQHALRHFGPHVLIEAMGFLPGHQLPLLARHCSRAPVHTSWLRNFHGSMRARFVDHAVVDRSALPPTAAAAFTEKATMLPHQLLVNAHASQYRGILALLGRTRAAAPHTTGAGRRPSASDAHGDRLGRSHPARNPMACSINRLNKLEPTSLDTWSSALRRSTAPLWVATGAGHWVRRGRRGAQRALRDEMAARGLRRQALVYSDRSPSAAAHLARVARCALALDVRRWGAHTTALDALWVGVGTLSVPGATLASRASHSIMAAVGAEELSAPSLRAKADLAVSLLFQQQVSRIACRRPTRRKPIRIESTLCPP